jgi:hypothetical protein
MRYTRSDFSSGEISPRLSGSTELPQYKTGCNSLKNMLPLNTGGVINRPGTQYIVPVKAVGTHWVVRGFVFASDDAFVLEIGEYYIRFIKNDVQVVTGGTTAYEVVTPWASIHVADLKFTQSGDQIWISHPLYRTIILTRYADTNWTLTYYDYLRGPYTLENSTTTTVTSSATAVPTVKNITGITKANPGVVTSAAHGYADGDIVFIEGIVGMTELNELPFKVRNKSTDTFELDYNGAGASLSTAAYTAYSSGGTIKKTSTLTGSTAIFSNVTGSKHAVGRTLWEVRHWIQAPAIKYAVSTENYNTPGTAIKCGGTWRLLTHGTWSGTITVQVSDDGGTTWTDARHFSAKSDKNYDTSGTETFSNQFLVRTSTDEVEVFAAGIVYITLASDPFEWVGVAHVVQVPTGGGGSSLDYTTADVVIEVPIGLTSATTVWSEGAWSQKRGYPACSSFFNDRLCFAGTLMEPNTIWFSKTGNYYDYGRSFPLADDDGITINANSREMNRIYNMVDVNRLVEFTSAGVFSTEAGPNGLLSPTSVINKANDLAGSSNLTPVIINDRAVYFQTFNRIMRDTAYSMEADGFTGINLTQFSDHMFKDAVAVEMAYQKEPWQTVWIVRSDGKLVSLTYTKQAEIYGWAEHSTSLGIFIEKYFKNPTVSYDYYDLFMSEGLFESVCVIPGSEIDDAYFVVARGNSETAGVIQYNRFIEKFSNRNKTTDPKLQVFLDCSKITDSPKIITRIDARSEGATGFPKITIASHGFSNGDKVEFSEIPDSKYSNYYNGTLGYKQFNYLNGKKYTVSNKTTDTFELSDFDATLFQPSFYLFIYGKARKVFSTIENHTGNVLSVLRMILNGYSTGAAGIDGIEGLEGSTAVVGFPFFSECEPSNIDFDTTAGSTQDKTKTVSNASVGLYETYGGKIGTERANMHDMTNNDGSPLHHVLTASQPTGIPPALFSGIFKQSIVGGSGNPISLIIRQEEPYPITITNINANVEIGE